uniref:DUF6465 family protein n=1 Tax=Ruminococcus sp. TaxID=41978 RepID=UPI00402A3267
MARPKKTESAKTTVTEATTKKVTAAAPKATRVRKTVSVRVRYGGIAWAAEHSQKKTAAKDIKLYVKPEENMVYYVINGDSGSFAL